ncbi:inositol oxygenase [Peziza echinospora]|nr:inositol oxygenase [Peziza echinospora]
MRPNSTPGVYPTFSLSQTSDLLDSLHIENALKSNASETTITASNGSKDTYRSYTTSSQLIQSFYQAQHTHQTLSFNLLRRSQFYSPLRHRPQMGIWEAIEKLNTLIDESDPDTESLPQIEHLLQTAEAIRAAGKPRWMVLTGLIHDLGKVMDDIHPPTPPQPTFSTQWDIVGDTFPVGCAFCPLTNILPHTFPHNPDSSSHHLSTKHGIYAQNCGIDNLILSWGHDEYLYLVLSDAENGCLLPKPALAMVRYHSFYPWHREGGYSWLMREGDEEMRRLVGEFSGFDLYSKSERRMDVEGLKPYYMELIDEFFPKKVLRW